MFAQILIGLAKDKSTWIGGISSFVASIAARDDFLPKTLEGWLAATLTASTILYMFIKITLLLRKETKRLEDDANR